MRGWAKWRICEERIVLLKSRSGREALAAAKRSGKAAEFSCENSDGRAVRFEFIGVRDLLRSERDPALGVINGIAMLPGRLCKDVPHHRSAHVREPEISSGMPEGQLLMIEAQ